MAGDDGQQCTNTQENLEGKSEKKILKCALRKNVLESSSLWLVMMGNGAPSHKRRKCVKTYKIVFPLKMDCGFLVQVLVLFF